MTDVIVKVLEAATSRNFLTLEEAKQMLGLPPAADPTIDPALEQQITIASATIAELCNREFAREKVRETWFDLSANRLFLTRFPVAEDDIEKVTAGGAIFDDDDYELEEKSGTLRTASVLAAPIRVTYTGGFDLPDDAPPPLKQATILLVTQQRSQATRESIEGIRMIAHKESRVLFFDPSQQAKSTTTAGSLGSGVKQVDDLLMHYVRHYV